MQAPIHNISSRRRASRVDALPPLWPSTKKKTLIAANLRNIWTLYSAGNTVRNGRIASKLITLTTWNQAERTASAISGRASSHFSHGRLRSNGDGSGNRIPNSSIQIGHDCAQSIFHTEAASRIGQSHAVDPTKCAKLDIRPSSNHASGSE